MKTEPEIQAGILILLERLKAIPTDGTEAAIHSMMAATAVIDGLMWVLGLKSIVGERLDKEMASLKKAAHASEN